MRGVGAIRTGHSSPAAYRSSTLDGVRQKRAQWTAALAPWPLSPVRPWPDRPPTPRRQGRLQPLPQAALPLRRTLRAYQRRRPLMLPSLVRPPSLWRTHLGRAGRLCKGQGNVVRGTAMAKGPPPMAEWISLHKNTCNSHPLPLPNSLLPSASPFHVPVAI